MEGRGPSAFERVTVILGFALLIAEAGLVIVGGLIMPLYGVAIMAAVWIVAFALAIRARARATLVLLIPVAFLAIWLAVAWLGDVLLGWTA